MFPPVDPTVPKRDYPQREDDLIERIARIVGQRNSPFAGQTVISTDVAVLGVHLDVELFPLEDLGFRAVTGALSDLAAMGARARAALVAVVAPEGADVEELHRGIADASNITNCPIVGGDLSSGRDVSIAVTVIGECPGGGAVLRSGAVPGDELLVTGPLGRSAAGLRRRREGAPLSDELVVAHRRPWPRLSEGQAARGAGVHAMMDLSDGLGLDLHRMADASKVGFELSDVPVANGATTDEATSGGEDYELLMATNDADRLRMVFLDRGLRAPITIGRVVANESERTLRGARFERRGWQHQL
jgi:thiamine-monophosphate kinase